MICPNCHTNLQDNANVCHKCGAVINTDGLKRQQQMAEDSRNGMGSTRRLNIQNNTYKRPSEKKSENFSGSGKSVSTGVLTGVLISAIIILVVAIIVVIFLMFSGRVSSVTVNPAPTETPKPVKKVSTYTAVKKDVTWGEAEMASSGANRHLVYINDDAEFQKVCNIADENDIKVFWAGAKRASYESWSEITWGDGSSFNISSWIEGTDDSVMQWYDKEPSYTSKDDGREECYLMVFKVGNKWCVNDAANDGYTPYKGRIGYIVETETEE